MSFSDAHFAHSRDTTLVNSPVSSHSRTPSDMSGPFMYANELTDNVETTSDDDFFSFYLDTEQPDESQTRLPYKHLLRYLKHSSLVREFRHRISCIVENFVEIGDLLFPPTHLLNHEIKKRVLYLTKYINMYLNAVVEHLEKRIITAQDCFRMLPSPIATDKGELALSIASWTDILDSLHKPTGREGCVFRELSTIYSSHIYQPFLQLHRVEPDHNMWLLDSQLSPISLLIREAAKLSDEADDAVRAIQEEFEATMTSQSDSSPEDAKDNLNAVCGKDKRHHTPSKSAPAMVRISPETTLRPRERENTL